MYLGIYYIARPRKASPQEHKARTVGSPNSIDTDVGSVSCFAFTGVEFADRRMSSFPAPEPC